MVASEDRRSQNPQMGIALGVLAPADRAHLTWALVGFVVITQAIVSTVAWSSDLQSRLLFDIPAQALETALVQFSKQAQLQVTAASVDLETLRSDAVVG